ncbi:Uncharacterised protein [Psychrobacter phenylpyruvicus]|uniref:Uncharacterized protein n=1 Tax=Psychrobacter phenylpyruvicus TaxID=29432 RepID=A0A379LIJ6_9GAMM|nr:Uncharacterised protein [Psychrobacter phenylpyruvicus]
MSLRHDDLKHKDSAMTHNLNVNRPDYIGEWIA